MTRLVRLSPGHPPDRWDVRVPGSKSITNRALLLAAVAEGTSVLRHPLRSDDTEAMVGSLRALGSAVEDEGDAWRVRGLGGPPQGSAEVWCGAAGTVARFVPPMLAAGRGTFGVDGVDQLRARPLRPLIDALVAQGASVPDGATHLPLRLVADGLSGGTVAVDSRISSQFLSGLLMAAPLARAATRLVHGETVSRPYLRITESLMRRFGGQVSLGEAESSCEPGAYAATELDIEPDASTASYFLGHAAVTGTTVRLAGFDGAATQQGDIGLVQVLEAMGCEARLSPAVELRGPRQLRGVDVEMTDNTDVLMTVACIAPFADRPTTIEGVGHARVKESDRLSATAENLQRLGIEVEEGRDHLRVHPGVPRPATLPTYDDHRIAMAFSLIGHRADIGLEDPDVVAKTCPTFFQLWRDSGARVEFVDS
jgi:3-phosphoshikimate 1-carboxyvinyltransferase